MSEPRRTLSSDSTGALVIGCDSRALGVARSLGRRGIPVWVLDEGDYLVARSSRLVSRHLPWPEGEDDAQKVEYLLELKARYGLEGWTLFATSDEGAALVARHHAALSGFRLTTPPWETMRWAYDKRLTYELALRSEVDCPWTRYPTSREQLASLDCAFPVILKPATKTSLNRFTHDKAWRAENRDELLARYDEACALVPPEQVMLQEFLPGGGESQFSFGALCMAGRPLAWVVARRSRQYPVDFGHSSSYVETVEEPRMEERARRLLAAMDYTGPVEVEFKHDPRTGSYKVLDVNPRLWTWYSIGRRAGVDFPYLAWRLARGEAVAELRSPPGMRWVRMGTDLPAAATEMRRGRLSPGAYVRSLRPPLEFPVFAVDDPTPTLAAGPLLLSRMMGRAPALLAPSLARSRRIFSRADGGAEQRGGAGERPYEISIRRDGPDPEWDAFVERCSGGHHVQTARWAEVKGTVGWSAARIVLRRDDEPVAGCQVLLRRLGPMGSLGYIPRGPVLADSAGPDALEGILDALEDMARRERVRYLKVQPPAGGEAVVARLEARGYVASGLEAAPTTTVLVDLRRPLDEILAGMRTNTRRNIRRARREGVSVRHGDERDLGTLVRMIDATGRRQGFSPYPARYYEQIWHSFAPVGQARLLLAEHAGTALSAVLLVAFGDSVIYKMGGWGGEGAQKRPNELMHWAAIEWARELGHRVYDLEGIEPAVARASLAGGDAGRTHEGLSHFKLGFGGEVTIFPSAYDYSPNRLLGAALSRSGPGLEHLRPLVARVLGRGR